MLKEAGRMLFEATLALIDNNKEKTRNLSL